MSRKVSAKFPYQSQFVDVYGSKMHYIEEGSGDPILFLHGMPASSYVWRNIIPHLSQLGRCIAPDLIGMGKSEKPDINYSVFDHIRYIEKFIETLDLKNITLVLHCWGSVIGFNYAVNHEDNCKAIIFYEAYLKSTAEKSLPLNAQLHLFSEEESLDQLLMNGTYYIDNIFPKEMLCLLSEEEIKQYREPFLTEKAGKVLCQYIKELPRFDHDKKIDELITQYSNKLIKSQLPKLMLYSIPGFVTPIATAMWAKENLTNLEIIEVGEELHYIQESDPDCMGEAMSIWLQGIEQTTT